MGLPNVMNTGRTAMIAAKAQIATTGHNIANANNEGYTRQRVIQGSDDARAGLGGHIFGSGTKISRVDRINDNYIEKQLRNSGKDLAHMEEKDLALKQTEDIFNEMGGEGINRLVAKFFNEFRKLSNDPDNEAIRESVREASNAMASDLRRLRSEVGEVRNHIDARIEGHIGQANTLAEEVKDLNLKITAMENGGGNANDLRDTRDRSMSQLNSLMNLSVHTNKEGAFQVEIKGVGPLINGPVVQKFSAERTKSDDEGKSENMLDILSTSASNNVVTHSLKGGKIGALLEVRDQTLSSITDRLDEIAFEVGSAVNQVHSQGVNRFGSKGINFFKPLVSKERAAEKIDLSDEIKTSVNNIATAAQSDSPGDNRIALAISGLQSSRLMDGGKTSVDDFYNSIITDIGVLSARNKSNLTQQKDIQSQLGKIREQISGVSLDEETANLIQFQHSFGAAAKVIQVADECLKTVLDLKR